MDDHTLFLRRFQLSDYGFIWLIHHGREGRFLRGGPYDDDLRNIPISYLYDGTGEFLVGVLEDKVVCMGGLLKKSDKLAEIKRIEVAHAYRRRGFGQQVLSMIEKVARDLKYEELCLRTQELQTPAQALFEKNGYVFVKVDAVGYYEMLYHKKL